MITAENEKHRWRFHYAHGWAEDMLPQDIFMCSEPMPNWDHPLNRKKTYGEKCKFRDHEGNLHDAYIITAQQPYNDVGGYLLLFGDKQGITEVMQYEEFDHLSKEKNSKKA